MDSGKKNFNNSNAKKFNGGPGKAGIIQPAIPNKDRIIPIIIISVSIFYLLSFFVFSF